MFDEDDFRGVLDELKDEVAPECHLAWSNCNLAQAKDRMRYLAKKLGLTKKQLGVTYHGLSTDFVFAAAIVRCMVAPCRSGVAVTAIRRPALCIELRCCRGIESPCFEPSLVKHS